jgi:hypothetical protein
MSQPLSLRPVVRIWTALTVLLALTGVLVLILSASDALPGDVDATAFVVLVNGVNVVLYLLVLVFRKRIERSSARLIDQSNSVHVTTTYPRERPFGRTLVLLLAVTGVFVTYLVIFDVDEYYALIREDGLVEYLSALFWFVSAALLAFHLLRVSRQDPGRLHWIFNLALIAFFIVCGGEEISWGQRITQHETPAWLEAVNVQDETTLHNIGSISVFANGFFVGTLVFFLLIPYLARRSPQAGNVLDFIRFPRPNRFAVYVYAASLVLWILVGLRFGTLGFHPFSVFEEEYYTQMDDEIFELLAAYAFLCFSIFHSLRTVSISGSVARPTDGGVTDA